MSETPVEAWKRHVLTCEMCRVAKSMGDLCLMGQTFWKPSAQQVMAPANPQPPRVVSRPVAYSPPVQGAAPYAPRVPVSSPAPAPAVSRTPFEQVLQQGGARQTAVAHRPAPAAGPHGALVSQITARVSQKVIARAESGAALAVPMEKTSTSVSIATAPGVILQMPERDIEVYAQMKQVMVRLLSLAEKLGKTIMVVEETRRHMKKEGQECNEEEVALVVSQVGRNFGGIDEADLFYDFEDVAAAVLNLGDRLGNFMRVDDDTRSVMRTTRALAVDMQGEIERSYDGKLPLDMDTRKLVRAARMLALDLQGEIERRVGT